MNREYVRNIYARPADFDGKTVTVGGWVRNIRDSKAFGFIDLNDGSCFNNLQIVLSEEKSQITMISHLRMWEPLWLLPAPLR